MTLLEFLMVSVQRAITVQKPPLLHKSALPVSTDQQKEHQSVELVIQARFVASLDLSSRMVSAEPATTVDLGHHETILREMTLEECVKLVTIVQRVLLLNSLVLTELGPLTVAKHPVMNVQEEALVSREAFRLALNSSIVLTT